MDNDEFLGHKLEDWWPVSPLEGPPLPKWMGITWPWYKPETAVLEIAYAWWETLGYWIQIFETNHWPPVTAIKTTWKVKNTSDESAVFKVRLVVAQSDEAQLDPGASFFFELPDISLAPGTHQFTLKILADGQVVREYPIKVIVE